MYWLLLQAHQSDYKRAMVRDALDVHMPLAVARLGSPQVPTGAPAGPGPAPPTPAAGAGPGGGGGMALTPRDSAGGAAAGSALSGNRALPVVIRLPKKVWMNAELCDYA